jgi:hypothetical protein
MEKLTEEGEHYNEMSGDIMEDLIEDGYFKRDIIAGINECAKMNSMDIGDDIILFIKGALWERKRIKKKKK